MVVSRGDDALLRLNGRRAWHFPQEAEGAWAGYHPRDSREAIDHLKELQSRGGEFLLFPQTGLWWLDHYHDLREYLERNGRLVIRDEATCAIYELNGATRHE
jgi:hypothetical protein